VAATLAYGWRCAERLAIAPAPQAAIKPAADQLAVLQRDQAVYTALSGGDGCAEWLAIAPAPQAAATAADQVAVVQLDQACHRALAGGDRSAERHAIAPAPQAAVTPAADQLAVLQLDQACHRALAGGDGVDLVVATGGNIQRSAGGKSIFFCLSSHGGGGLHHAAKWLKIQKHFGPGGVLSSLNCLELAPSEPSNTNGNEKECS
jgi:hypothetical protein